ncbi:MAG: MFS transporter [Gammaproteobacteria bacterium]
MRLQDRQRTSLFANRNFSLLFAGSSVSAVGDQFTLVALPWLVLKLTGNPAALGVVLAVMALPRAVFMLLGGAVVDRFSPRRVLLAARAANAACIVALAVLVLMGAIHMSLVYLLALGIGLSTAFAYPAGSAILPQLVGARQLHAANALFMGMRQLSLIIGPVFAGFVIALGAQHVTGAVVTDARGMGAAFSIDAFSFMVSLASLLLIRVPDEAHTRDTRGGVFASIRAGVQAVWADPPLRAFVLYVAAVSVLVMGPIQVGLPVLADTRLGLGAAALGILMTANGAGMFAGSVCSGIVTRWVRGRLGIMVLGFDALSGLALAALMLVHRTWSGAALLVCVGLLGGIVQIAIFTWIQQRVPQQLMGRAMSILLFTFLGLGPLSAAFAGLLLKWVPLSVLFAVAGLTLTVIALGCLASRDLRAIRALATLPPTTLGA